MTMGIAAWLPFLLAVLAVYWLIPGLRHRRIFLAVASLTAYIRLDPATAPWMILTAAVTLLGVRFMRRGGRRAFWAALPIVMAIFIGLKYFAPVNPSTSTSLPGRLGVSYLCFQAILSLVEGRRRKFDEADAGGFVAYFFFFPTMTMGPIKSLARFLKAGEGIGRVRLEDLSQGSARILLGLGKKMVLADTLAGLTGGFAAPHPTGLQLWTAFYAYALQIYFDFSGYTDVAVGMARLFGYRIEENFDWPYLKTNLRDFWRSWHKSLTGFMREVVYIPMGGNRRGSVRTYANLLVVFLLIGLWHGAQPHFLAWGAYHGAGMVIDRLWRRFAPPRNPEAKKSRARSLLGWAVTFHFVALGWVLFACDLEMAMRIYRGLFGGW